MVVEKTDRLQFWQPVGADVELTLPHAFPVTVATEVVGAVAAGAPSLQDILFAASTLPFQHFVLQPVSVS